MISSQVRQTQTLKQQQLQNIQTTLETNWSHWNDRLIRSLKPFLQIQIHLTKSIPSTSWAWLGSHNKNMLLIKVPRLKNHWFLEISPFLPTWIPSLLLITCMQKIIIIILLGFASRKRKHNRSRIFCFCW